MAKTENSAKSAKPAPVVHIVLTGTVPAYRPGKNGKLSTRETMYKSLAAFDGKPLADWYAHIEANGMPAQRKVGSKTQIGPVQWVQHFTRKQPGYITFVAR